MLEREMAGPRGLGPWPSGLGALSASALGLGCWGPSAPRPWALVTGGDSKGTHCQRQCLQGLGNSVSFADLPSGASRETLFL